MLCPFTESQRTSSDKLQHRYVAGILLIKSTWPDRVGTRPCPGTKGSSFVPQPAEVSTLSLSSSMTGNAPSGAPAGASFSKENRVPPLFCGPGPRNKEWSGPWHAHLLSSSILLSKNHANPSSFQFPPTAACAVRDLRGGTSLHSNLYLPPELEQ